MRGFRFPLIMSALLAGLGILGFGLAPRAPSPDEAVMLASEDPDPERAASGLVGLWSRTPGARGDGDPVRFYFFHESGIGLYRYGKVGLNTTNSFDWRIRGDDLELVFRKTGAVARTNYRIDKSQALARLVLDDDPKEPLLHDVAYTYVPPSSAADALVDVFGIGGRLWIDEQKFATGGTQFSLYQLRDPAIDGRGVGWHHIGDFNDWSTEALAYRDAGDLLELSFNLRGDKSRTRMKRTGDLLLLEEDPRSFWHVRTYKDGGPSFGAVWSSR
jgi:hypothetical protein